VVSPSSAAEGVLISDPAEAVLRQWHLHGEPILIVLAWMPEAELRELARQFPEAEMIVGGLVGQAIAPEHHGLSWLAAAANKGKFLIELRDTGKGWRDRVVEMSSSFTDDAEQLKLLQSFRSELEARDLLAEETGFVSEFARRIPDDFRVAGSEQCRDCHKPEWESWRESAHAQAWTILADQGAHVDAACQVCHSTGFGMPDGFASVKRSPQRVDVGCENCHGPSGRHVQEATIRTPFPAANQCTTCHDAENSPNFEFNRYWDRIRHGELQSEEAVPR
jgi:hypothetical protein